MSDKETTIGDKIKYYRNLTDFTQKGLAISIGRSSQLISSWELGRYTPSILDIHLLCREFNISVDELLYGTKYSSVSGDEMVLNRALQELDIKLQEIDDILNTFINENFKGEVRESNTD